MGKSALKALCSHPLFLLGLLIRIGLIFSIQPLAVTDWYEPFLNMSTMQVTFDPWATWLEQGGAPEAFPYGYVMWLAFIPFTLLFKLVGLPLVYGYGFTLLLADFCLLIVLRKLKPKRDRLLLAVYWLSPIVLFATYGLGFNDLIPVLILALSLYFTRQRMLFLAGALSIAAISAKFSMLIALPFFLIYLFHNSALRQLLPDFLKGATAMIIMFWLPFILSDAGVNMLFSNPLMGNIYQFALNIGNGTQLYLVPLAYLVMLYAAWRVRRLNFDLFYAMLGMAFLLVVLMAPTSPGWFIWVIPLLVTYQTTGDRIAIMLATVFSVLYVLSSLLTVPYAAENLWILDVAGFSDVNVHWNGHSASLVHTVMVAVGIVLSMRLWRDTVRRNDYFRLSRKPFVIGVAGDSGAGKDTFSDAIKGLFGSHSVVTLSGDDYHLWDRQKPIWQVMTHLNPMANDLEGYANDLVALTDGKSIHARCYDHQTGKMSHPFKLKSKDVIIANGLHALYLPMLRNCYDLSVYLDIDENLRRYLKLQRDVSQRGHSEEKVLASFDSRQSDSERFIKPQAAHADLILSLQPIHPRILDDANGKHPLRYKLIVRSQHGFNEHSLLRVLVGVCGLHVDMVTGNDAAEIELTIEGETSAEDIALAAQIICPRIFEFLDILPDWQDGVIGLMQLITLSHINQALTKRFI